MENIHETPKILFKNKYEWEKGKKAMYNEIKKTIYMLIVEDTYEYRFMKNGGLMPRQELGIRYTLEKELIKLIGKNKEEWVQKLSWLIIYGIEGFIHGLVKTKTWEILYNNTTSKQIANIIYKNIKYQLGDDGFHSPNLLENIPQFKCSICGKIDNHSVDNKCIDCIEKVMYSEIKN